jgi:hypothetical protein
MDKKEQTLLSFLKETKDGKYSEIDIFALELVRVNEEREEIPEMADLFYYSIG